MKRFVTRFLVCCLAAWVGADSAFAADDKKQPTAAELRKERRAAVKEAEQNLRKARRSGDEKAIAEAKAALESAKKKARGKGADMAAEFAALMQASEMLVAVADEASAKKAADKIITMFSKLPAPDEVSDDDIELWSTEQNKLNREMERLRKEPWFEASGLQEAWTAATDPFSRKRAIRQKK
ncbi:MAG: hypothetical protein IJ993_09620 [Akkermansia sp.]|nr:hypothetical protein [Akkermansia sp.]